MTELCPNGCGRPATECERCVGGSESRHDAWRELQCANATITRLRRELAEARAVGELERRTVAWLAERHDEIEMYARSVGAFSMAACHQQFAEWTRCGTLTCHIRGTDGRTLVANYSDGLVITEGDARWSAEALNAIGFELLAQEIELDKTARGSAGEKEADRG